MSTITVPYGHHTGLHLSEFGEIVSVEVVHDPVITSITETSHNALCECIPVRADFGTTKQPIEAHSEPVGA